jgi:hypothetical protein
MPYLISEWDGTLEVVRASHHPEDPEDTLRVIYPDGATHKVTESYFFERLGAVPANIH